MKRNKTDAADACALLEAARCADIEPVRVESVEQQQALQGLHRIRSLWMSTRTSRIDALRGFGREFGLAVPPGARTGIEAISRVLADPNSPVPMRVRRSMKLLVEEVRLLEQRIADLERELAEQAKQSPACCRSRVSACRLPRRWQRQRAAMCRTSRMRGSSRAGSD